MKRNLILWVFVAALSMMLFACSKDEPTPTQEPPENPNQWGSETPHGFYFDLNAIELIVNDDGFLRFKGNRPGSYVDSVVIIPGFIKSSNAKRELLNGQYAISPITIKGKEATPWDNVEQYVKMFSTLGFRPDSKYSSDFPELADLPVGDVKYFGFFVWDKLIRVDIISHKYFNADIPAGGSMRGREPFEDIPELNRGGLKFMTVDGNSAFYLMSKGADVHGNGLKRSIPLGEADHYGYISSNCDILIDVFPDAAGDYPMTLTIEFESGIILSKDFKIRFVTNK